MRFTDGPIGMMRDNQKMLADLAERILERLSYDGSTGIFTWLPRDETDQYVMAWNARYAGKPAGRLHPIDGYVTINIKVFDRKIHFFAHRAAFLFMTGSWPDQEVDHINRIRSDNRYENLRLVSRLENCKNSCISSSNKSGATGVHFDERSRKWVSSITIDYKSRIIGRFTDKNEAIIAAARERHSNGFDSGHGSPRHAGDPS